METIRHEYAGKPDVLSIISDRLDENDPVFAFERVMREARVERFIPEDEKSRRGRRGYDKVDMLKTVLFAFTDMGYASLREIEDRCLTDIRYMYLMKGETPSYRTFGHFINGCVKPEADDLFRAIASAIIEAESVDVEHVYVDGTKIEANANKYSWVWKKATEKSRFRLYGKVTKLIGEINAALPQGEPKFPTRSEYSHEGIESLLRTYAEVAKVDPKSFVHGSGHRKSQEQRNFESLAGYAAKLREYAVKVKTCGPHRNSYSKTDTGATFMRIKRDYMGNDRLLPAYNVQVCIADEYAVTVDVEQYCSDMDCFVPLMEKFHAAYGRYPKYPVADAGYGSFNNYLYCESHGMEKYMKFTTFKKETTDAEYRDDPFRAVNFKTDEDGNLVCPGSRTLRFAYRKAVKGNLYGRQEEYFTCDDCGGCQYAARCKKTDKNRTVRINTELTAAHAEVIGNLESVHGVLLRRNRCVQAEGAFGVVKYDRGYDRTRRKGLDRVVLEVLLVFTGFNLRKRYYKQRKSAPAA